MSPPRCENLKTFASVLQVQKWFVLEAVQSKSYFFLTCCRPCAIYSQDSVHLDCSAWRS